MWTLFLEIQRLSLLDDEYYVTKIKQRYNEWIEEGKEIQDPRVLWDFVKYKVRYETIDYSKKKAKERRATRRRCYFLFLEIQRLSLLDDEYYVTKIKQRYNEWIEEGKEIQDPRVLWDFVKYKVRYEIIDYSKKKAKERRATRRRCYFLFLEIQR